MTNLLEGGGGRLRNHAIAMSRREIEEGKASDGSLVLRGVVQAAVEARRDHGVLGCARHVELEALRARDAGRAGDLERVGEFPALQGRGVARVGHDGGCGEVGRVLGGGDGGAEGEGGEDALEFHGGG